MILIPDLDNLLDEYLTCSNIDDCWGVLSEDLTRFGFDKAVYGSVPKFDPTRLHDLSGALLLSSYDTEAFEAYVLSRTFIDDYLYKWSVTNTGALSWGAAHRAYRLGEMSAKEEAVHLHNLEISLDTGFTFAFPTARSGRKSTMGLAFVDGGTQSDADCVWSENKARIESSLKLFETVARLFPNPVGNIRLTVRQRQILTLLAEGKTVRDVSGILSLHRRTVEDHLASARDLLDAETTLHAMAQAVRQGHI